MKTDPTAQESGWRVSFWFAVSSPLIGVLLAFFAAAIFLSLIEEVMSITLIICVLVILLFGFDSTGQVRTQLALKIAQEIANFLKYRSSKD